MCKACWLTTHVLSHVTRRKKKQMVLKGWKSRTWCERKKRKNETCVFPFCLLCRSEVLGEITRATCAWGHMLKLNVWVCVGMSVCVCETLDSTVEFCMSCTVTAASIQTLHDVHSHTHSFPVHTSSLTYSIPSFFIPPSLNPSHSLLSPLVFYISYTVSRHPEWTDVCYAIRIHTWENMTLVQRECCYAKHSCIHIILQHPLQQIHLTYSGYTMSLNMQSLLFICPEDVTQSSAAVPLNHWLECVCVDDEMCRSYISAHMHSCLAITQTHKNRCLCNRTVIFFSVFIH